VVQIEKTFLKKVKFFNNNNLTTTKKRKEFYSLFCCLPLAGLMMRISSSKAQKKSVRVERKIERRIFLLSNFE